MKSEEPQQNPKERVKGFVRRTYSAQEMESMVSPAALERLRSSITTMGPFEADPSHNTPEHEAWLDRWVEGYCASGHDPNYTGPDDD